MRRPQSGFGRPAIARRDFLRALGVAGAGAALVGCQVSTSADDKKREASFDIEIRDSGAELPSGDTTIRWLNGGPGPKSFFFGEFIDEYTKMHSNITVQYDELPNREIGELLPLQLRKGDAADVFLVVNVPMNELVASGEVAALDDVIADFEAWKKQAPFGIFVPGLQEFDGKMYAAVSGSHRRSTLLLYNTEYVEAAGYDFSSEPVTWSTFREAAKKITKQGKGEYFGLMQPDIFQGVVFDTVQLAGLKAGAAGGASAPGINWETGEYSYHGDEMLAFIELLLAMKDDGSIFPAWASTKEQEARAQFAQGAAGMMLQGPWNIPVWRDQNPDFIYGIARLPVPDGTTDPTVRYAVGGSNQFAVYAKAGDDQKAIAGDMLHYIGTEEGQRAWNRLTGAADPAWSLDAMADFMASDQIDDHNRRALEIFDETVRLAPSPLIRNPEVEAVEVEIKPVKPNLGEVVQGILTGQLSDPAKALRELSTAAEKALDDAIAAAAGKGANVSRDDWKFANWDPAKDYLEADYAKL